MPREDCPRDPDAYDWLRHATEDSIADKWRFLTEEMVRETIRSGRDCVRVKGEPIRRKREFEGVDTVVVLDDRDILTAWTEVRSVEAAIMSDRWELAEIRVIQESDIENRADAGELN